MRAVTYEYGNAFLIVAGLLNLLVVIDAYDIAHGPQVMREPPRCCSRCSRSSSRSSSRCLAKDDAREQVRFGGMMFAGFLVAALVLGWLMYPFPL